MSDNLALAANVPLTMKVKYCDLVPSRHPDKYPAQVKFKDHDGGALYLDTPDVLSCLRNCGAIQPAQFDALHAKAEDQGSLPSKGTAILLKVSELTFLQTQAPKEKKKVLSINGAKADDAPAPPPPAASSPTAAAGAANGNGHAKEQPKHSDIYLAQTRWVLDTIVPLYREKKIEPSATDIHAMVATLFIAKTRNG
jgi:hypothetical protein